MNWAKNIENVCSQEVGVDTHNNCWILSGSILKATYFFQQGMEEAFDSGKVKAIGVSNFNRLQIERVMKMARIKPVSQQVSWSELGHAITIISTSIKLKKGLFCA